jgi:hypothetical protein
MQPSSYRAAARAVRKMADQLERYAEAETPRECGIRTQTINRLSRYAQHLSQRHRRRNES